MNKTEVLSPAGSFTTFKSVINAGADAVYLAGNMFGARAYAGNLSDTELLDAIDYAHLFGKKLYLTVNTLLKNTELFGTLYDYINPLYKAGLDAVIVQDYGVAAFLSDNFPDLPLHASTQMTIMNSDYIHFLKKISNNFTRIVPARELSLSQIKALKEESGLEVETFVHGALCYSYSGQCFMSSFLGGRSGNRGRCAGCCRLEFESCGKTRTLLSLKDLCTLDILPDIIEAGVNSLKIEGRMKSTGYAAGVTEIYRKYVDLYYSNQDYSISKKDVQKLLMLFDRGGQTNGYYIMHNGPKMLANEEKSSKSLEEKFAYEKEILAKSSKDIKLPADMELKLIKDKPVSLTMKCRDVSVTAFGETLQPAQNSPLLKEDVKARIQKLGNTVFFPNTINIDFEEGLFLGNKALNELRRNCCDMLTDKLLSEYRRAEAPKKEYDFSVSHKKAEYKGFSVRVFKKEQGFAALSENISRLVLEPEIMTTEELLQLKRACAERKTECCLALKRTMYDKSLPLCLDKFDSVLLRNVQQLQGIRDLGYKGKIYADYTIYAFNDLSAGCLNAEFDAVTAPIELSGRELKHLALNNMEVIVYGRYPLMTSAGCIDKNNGNCHKNNPSFGFIRDRKNAALPYVTACRDCYNIIFNSVPLYLLDKISEIKMLNAEFAGLIFTDEDEEAVRKILKFAAEESPMPEGFTRGHYKNSVE